MSDWLILRFPLDDPQKPEVIEVLANVPSDWKQYLEKKAKEIKKEGRYIAANILYDNDSYYPDSAREKHKTTEEKSQ